MFDVFMLVVEILSALSDAARFGLMDTDPALFAELGEQAAERGCTLYEDGTIGCN